VYGALNAYFIHDTTFSTLFTKINSSDKLIYYVLTIVTIVFSSYSLFSKPIPESTPYTTNDSFSMFSSHYQRVGYSVIIIGLVCITEFAKLKQHIGSGLTFAIAYGLNFAVLLAQMLGMLSNPMVTLMWFLEQLDVHVLGATPRVSDVRIVVSGCFNGAIVIGMYFLTYKEKDAAKGAMLGAILAWVVSHNLMSSFGVIKPFKVVNDSV
jgi:hypothetical protein